MQLSQEDKNALEALSKSEWWRVLKRIEEEYILEFNKKIMCADDFDIDSPETQKKLKEASMYIKARKWVFDQVRTNTLKIVNPL